MQVCGTAWYKHPVHASGAPTTQAVLAHICKAGDPWHAWTPSFFCFFTRQSGATLSIAAISEILACITSFPHLLARPSPSPAGQLPMAPGMFGNGQMMPPLGMVPSGNSIQAPSSSSGWVLGPNGMMYLQHGTNAMSSAFYSSGTGAYSLMRPSLGTRLSNGASVLANGQYSGALGSGTGPGVGDDEGGMVAIAGMQPRSEIWGESEAGDISFARGSGYSPMHSNPSSRPQSARSMSDPVTIISREGLRLRQHSPALPRGLLSGSPAAGGNTASSHPQQQGPLGPQPFRTSPLRQLVGDSGSGGIDQVMAY